jgi:hypothetical protein
MQFYKSSELKFIADMQIYTTEIVRHKKIK